MYVSIRIVTLSFAISGIASAGQSVVIDSPRGGEVYVEGQTQYVTLDSKTHYKSVRIELSRDGGTSFSLLGVIDNTVAVADRNVLKWTVTGPDSNDCQIRATAILPPHNPVAVSGSFAITSTVIGSGNGVPSGTAGGDLTGTYPNPVIAPAAVTATKISSGQASNNFVLAANGNGGVNWIMPPTGPQGLVGPVGPAGGQGPVGPPGGITSITAGSGVSVTGSASTPTVAASFGTAAGTVCQGNDSRLSDARAPLSGSASYIQNQSVSSQPADFNISGNGLIGGTLGVGTPTPAAVVHSLSTGSGLAGQFEINNPANVGACFYALTNGTGDAGVFRITNPNSGADAVFAQVSGAGNCIICRHTNASGDFLTLQNGGPVYSTVANIDNTGKANLPALTVDTNTLVVDPTTHRVGIGTSTPSVTLDVNGSIQFQATTQYSSVNYCAFVSDYPAIMFATYSTGAAQPYNTGQSTQTRYLLAPVHFPHGATLTSFTASLVGPGGAGDCVASLMADSTTIATVSTTGGSSGTFTASCSHVVNNQSNSYLVRVSLPSNGSNNFGGIVSARFAYTVTQPLP